MELIDRRKLVSDFWKGVEDGSILSYEDTDDLMENAPTVDAVEVVHGRWKPYYDYFTKRKVGWICSNCSGVTNDLSNGETNFCPECGAKMDGDGDGT